MSVGHSLQNWESTENQPGGFVATISGPFFVSLGTIQGQLITSSHPVQHENKRIALAENESKFMSLRHCTTR